VRFFSNLTKRVLKVYHNMRNTTVVHESHKKSVERRSMGYRGGSYETHWNLESHKKSVESRGWRENGRKCNRWISQKECWKFT